MYEYFPWGTFQGRASHLDKCREKWELAGGGGNTSMQVRNGSYLQGGRESPVHQEPLVLQAPRGTRSGAEAAPSHAHVPKTSPFPPGPPALLEVIHFHIYVFLLLGTIGEYLSTGPTGRTAAEETNPRHPQLKITLFPRKPPWLRGFQPEAAGGGLGRGDGSTPDPWPRRDLPPPHIPDSFQGTSWSHAHFIRVSCFQNPNLSSFGVIFLPCYRCFFLRCTGKSNSSIRK